MIVVFDLETDAAIRDARGTTREEQIRNLNFSCASVLSIPLESIGAYGNDTEAIISTGTMKTYWRDNQHDIDTMLASFEAATCLVGYNTHQFDFLVLRKHYRDKQQYHRHLCKSLDVFSRVRDVACFWPKLDNLLKRNGFVTKTSNGLEAIKMFADGRLDELRNYCESDVKCCAKLALASHMLVDVPNGVGTITVPGHVFNVQSFILALGAASQSHDREFA